MRVGRNFLGWTNIPLNIIDPVVRENRKYFISLECRNSKKSPIKIKEY